MSAGLNQELCESEHDSVLLWCCTDGQLVCRDSHDSQHHILSPEETRSLLRSKEVNDPEAVMKMIHREKERKISVRLEQMLEEFREQLEVKREKLEDDYVGFQDIFHLVCLIFPLLFSRTSRFGRF